LSDCVFCAIVTGVRTALVIDEDDDTIAFLDIAPATPGHTLVIPRAHVRDICSLDSATAAAIGVATARVAQLLRDRLKPAGMNVMNAAGVAGWQSVFHLHMHVVPRYDANELTRGWIPRPGVEADLRALHARILRDCAS
jgi:histidine triad (HIT) family protein